MPGWIDRIPVAITVCDVKGTIIEMNDCSARYFAQDGGRDLCGRSLLDCHPEPSRSQLQQMLAVPQANTYTVVKNGCRRLVHQAPWYEAGVWGGYVELVFEIPDEMPLKIRS